jgi:hypothetical protein
MKREFSAKKRALVELDAQLDGASARVIARALRRAGRDGVVDLGPGRFEGFELDRKVEVSSREAGLTEVAGTVCCTGGPVLVRGLVIRPSAGQAAVSVDAGEAVLMDCTIHGRVDTARGASVHIVNCSVSAGGVAWSLAAGGSGEAVGSRFTGAPAGIYADQGASCALYACRVEGCHGEAETGPGAGLFGSFADLYIEGTEFFSNEVGLYLKSCGETLVASCHFHGNATGGVITEEAAANRTLTIAGCLFDSAEGAAVTPIALHGGRTLVVRTRISGVDSGITTSQAGLHVVSSTIRAGTGAAIDLQGGSLKVDDSELESGMSAAISAEGTIGEISGGVLRGTPPVRESGPPAIRTDGVGSMGASAEDVGTESVPSSPGSLDSALAFLERIIGQAAVREEMGRLIRLAFAARQRRLQNLPSDALNFSGVLLGPPGSGKAQALGTFAEALCFLGELDSAEVAEVALDQVTSLVPGDIRVGFLIVDTRSAPGVSLASPGVIEALLLLARETGGRTHVLLDGDNQTLQAVMRATPELAREFPIEMRFNHFGPPELAALFHAHCKRQGIRVSLDAAKALPVIMHGLHDRLHRRFTDTNGIEELFADAHRNYLERCSRLQRFDLEMETADISVSLDRETMALMERSADLVVVCPSCGAENPWLPGMGTSVHCLHCDTPYTARFGTLRNSAFFRQRKSKGIGVRSGAVAMRRVVTAAIRARAGG